MGAAERACLLLSLLMVLALVGGQPVHAAPPEQGPGSEAASEERESESSLPRPGAPGPLAESVGAALGLELRGPAEPLDPERMRLIWDPASVAWPLMPLAAGAASYTQLAAHLDQREGMIEGRVQASSVRGAVDIDDQRAVGVWIAALETVRVRQFGPPVELRFIRGVDGNAAVIEAARELAPGPGGERRFEIMQPPSTGAVWSIEADQPTRVMIERAIPRPVRYAAVEVEQAVLAWIHRQDPIAQLPSLLIPADDLDGRLHLHAALGQELLRIGGQDAHFEAGVEAWRMLAAINEIDHQRPTVRPYYVRDQARKRPLPLDDTQRSRLDTEDSRDYRLARKPKRWTVSRKGAGQLRIAARSWAPEGESLQPAELRIYANGRFIQRLPLSDRQAKHSVDPNTALPQLESLFTPEGEAVGEFAGTVIVLAPGRVDYELELVGGPALISIEGARRIEASLLSLKGWTPRKRAKAGRRALEKTSSSAATWLSLLLGRETLEPLSMTFDDPRIDALAARSPLLAIEVLALLAADERVDAIALGPLLERVQPWLATLAVDPEVDPAVRGQLRARWLELIAIKGATRDVGLIIEQVEGGADPITELPVAGLRLLAELFEPTQMTIRSPVLAVLELARARAPADEGLREQTLRLWSALSRWSRRRPVSDIALDSGLPFAPIAQWLVPRTSLPVDPSELANTWLRLDIGKPVRVRAKLGPDAIRRDLAPATAEGSEGPGAGATPTNKKVEGHRMRLLDIHVASPLDDPAPVMLQVDDQRWWSPQLSGVVRHRVAVAEGLHELVLHGPAQTVAWAELPPADDVQGDPRQLGRRERMWSLPDADWYLPGPAIPGVVRLELRWPMNVEPRAVKITMHERGDYEPGMQPPARTLLFDPRRAEVAGLDPEDAALAADPVIVDRAATPLAGSTWASARHDISLKVSASTTSLSFDVEDGLPLPASLSLRRGLQPGDLFEGMAQPRVVDAREDERVAGAFDGLTALDGEALFEELEGLSRLLFYTPDDFESRARRAALLLMLGETGHARADLVRLAAWGDRQSMSQRRRDYANALLGELEGRFDALIEPREIVVTDPDAGEGPILVEPALAAVVGSDRVVLEGWLGLWAELRNLADDEALTRIDGELAGLALAAEEPESAPADLERLLLLGEVSRAEVMSRDSLRAREASRNWLELYGRLEGVPGHARAPLAIGLAAIPVLLSHLDNPESDARDAGVAYGLARELEPSYGHTSVRRLAFIAALRSGWETINHSVDNAGFERLELPVSELRRSPSARVREALLVAPWSAGEAEELRPGHKGVLAWDAKPGTVNAEVWCRAARPDLGPRDADLADEPLALGKAKLLLRLRSSGSKGDTTVEEQIELDDGELKTVSLPVTRKARHRLEVTLGDNSIWLCSWRTRTLAKTQSEADDAQVVEARRRATWWTAEADRAVEFVILGPATLNLEVRGVSNPELDKQPGALIASVEALRTEQTSLRAEGEEQGSFGLQGGSERAVITEARRHFRVNYANGHTLVLAEPIAYRVRLRTDRGRALLRARVRRDRGEVPPPAQVSLREIDPRDRIYAEEFDWRTGGPVNTVVARDEIAPIRNEIGSLDARIVVGLDDLAENENFAPRFGLAARAGWRRELIPNALWIRASVQARSRVRSASAGGGILGVGARVAPLGVRLGAELDALGGQLAGQPVGSVRFHAWVDRPTWLGRFVQLRPGLTAGVRWQSLNRQRAAALSVLQDPHPRVFNAYIEDHPLLLRPELELRALPFQDMALSAMASLVPNSDLRGFDHVNLDLGMVGIGRRPQPWVPTWGLSYQLSNRFADAHRSNLIVRHRIEAELGVAVWVQDDARVAIGLKNQLYLSQGADDFARDVIQLWLRVDAVFGRRLRDYGPGELWFAEPWAPRGWGDDPHQAPSTQLRVRRARESN